MTNATRKGGIQPTVAGKATARAGRSAGYRSQQMPMCNYGAACTRRDCVYRHPPKGSECMRSDEVCKAFLAGACLYGSKCYCIHPDEDEAERLRQKYAGTPCRWGEECRTQHCLYAHPSDFYDDPTDFFAQPTDHLAQPIDGFAYSTQRDSQPIDDFIQPADFDGEGLPDLTALRAWLPLAQDQLCPPCATGTQGREHESQAPVTGWAPASEQAGQQGRSSNWVPNPTAPEWVPYQPAPTSIASFTAAAPWDSQASQYNPTPGSWAAVAIAPPPSDGVQPSQARRREGSRMIHQPEALYSLLPLSFMTLLRPAEGMSHLSHQTEHLSPPLALSPPSLCFALLVLGRYLTLAVTQPLCSPSSLPFRSASPLWCCFSQERSFSSPLIYPPSSCFTSPGSNRPRRAPRSHVVAERKTASFAPRWNCGSWTSLASMPVTPSAFLIQWSDSWRSTSHTFAASNTPLSPWSSLMMPYAIVTASLQQQRFSICIIR